MSPALPPCAESGTIIHAYGVCIDMADDYRPIDCALHDRLESLATVGRAVTIEYRDEHGLARRAQDVIVDVYARAGVEYLRTQTGLTIRLDRLVGVDGRSYAPGAGSDRLH